MRLTNWKSRLGHACCFSLTSPSTVSTALPHLVFINIFLKLVLWEFQKMHSLLTPTHFIALLCLPPPYSLSNKRKEKVIKNNNNKISLLCLSQLFIMDSFVVVALRAVVCHTVDHFAQTSLLESIHCNELLAWFKASDFWYTINTVPSQRLLLDILLLSRVMKILQLWFPWTGSCTRYGRS